ncbi:F-BAR and double SH3 domains protein 1-like [Synchiropus splendidus]|uniref:F-BAR and double SH3 domains protein 1-like n=1 Tax=Synchiropus splendidus TaxID=270530 RepID=UPI00237DB486|nr:F-BAR and double SH3 domains protein 1-like [Synchiropus splendidus]
MQRRCRKVTECQQVKLKFAEQVRKLLLKHHQSTELLQDIRSFSKQRASIERDYGQALQKLASQFQRRDWQKGMSEAHISGVSGVWCSLLDATAKSAASHLAAAGDYRQMNEHICNTLHNAKDTQVKRSLKELQNEQDEVMAALKELNGIKKQYQQLSHIANVAREKAADSQRRARKNESGSFNFQSGQNKMASKLCSRSKECDKLLIEVRNEYLLTLAAMNTHERHYYTEGLPRMMQQINSDIFDSITRHFSLLCETEMEMCLTTHKNYRSAWDGVLKLARETNMQQFLRDSDSFKRTTEYTFQPTPQDQVCVLQDICGPAEDSWLNKEAKKWVAQASHDYKMAAQAEKVLETLTSRAKILTGDAGRKVQQQIADVQSSIRKNTLSRVKAEARLALLAQRVEGTELWIDLAMTQAEQDLERDERFSERTKSTEEFSEDELDLIYFVEEDDEKGTIFSDPALTSILCLCPAVGRVTCSYEAPGSSEPHWIFSLRVMHVMMGGKSYDEHSNMEGEELQGNENGEMEDWLKACNSTLCLPTEDLSLLDTSPCLSKIAEQKGAVKQDAARALSFYQAQSAEELSFHEGALIQITQEVAENRCLEREIGVIPPVLVGMICDEEQEEVEDAGQLPCNPLTLRSTDLDEERTLATEPTSVPDKQEDSGESGHYSPAACGSRLRPCRPPPPPPPLNRAQSSHPGTKSKT